jgi:type VI secretion system protein ImpE
MNASEFFESCQLQAAIDAQIQKVRGSPSDQGARMFLYELFLFAGDLDRARKQIDVLNYNDPKQVAAIERYKQVLDAEQMRRDVLAGKEQPKVLKDAPAHLLLRLEALKHYAANEIAKGDEALAQANAETPDVKVKLNDREVEGLRDGDELFGTVLEVFGTGGVYCWVPLEQVESILMEKPRSPRDALLAPATLSLREGPSGDILLPAVYPGSWSLTDDTLRLGRAADWSTDETRPVRGVGGRVFLDAAGTTYPLLDLRELIVQV